MSEESGFLYSKCPCGKGKSVWSISDDPYDTSGPTLESIDCPFCIKENHIESSLSCLRSHNVTSYYLVPNAIEHMDQPRKPIPKNFIEHLVQLYSLNDLNRVIGELSHCKNIGDMSKERVLSVISEQHNRFEGTKRVSTIKKNVQAAIDVYPDHEDSYDRFMERIRIYREYQKRILDECTLIESPSGHY